jgi:hypothetical protein
MYGSHYALVLPNSPTAQQAAKITLIAKRRHINAAGFAVQIFWPYSGTYVFTLGQQL